MKLINRFAQVVTTLLILLVSAGSSAAPFSYSANFNSGIGAEWSIATSYNNNDAGIIGRLENGSATLSVNGQGGGTSSLSFRLLGFQSVDGVNCCTDTFRLVVNGSEVLNANFALQFCCEQINVNPLSATITTPFAGARDISFSSISLLAGINTIMFDYGAMQGFFDESWGLDDVVMNGVVADAPEPAALLLMLSGLALVGLQRRRSAC